MTGAGLRGARREDQQPSLRQAVLRSEWRRRRRTARGRRRVMVLLAVAAIVADQTAKWVVRETIRRGEDGVSFSGLALGHNRNDGIAFRLFAGSGRAVGIATALALPLLAVALGLLARSRPLTAIAGALGRRGAAVGLCGTCMDARGFTEERLSPGTHRSTLEELADWTLWAERVLVF